MDECTTYNESLRTLEHRSLASTCTSESGFSFTNLSIPLSASTLQLICQSTSCWQWLTQVTQTITKECKVGDAALYKDIVNPINQTCLPPTISLLSSRNTSESPVPSVITPSITISRPTTTTPTPSRMPVLEGATRVTTATAPREHLDVNILLVAIACGVVVIAIVGFIAFYVDYQRRRPQDHVVMMTPPLIRAHKDEDEDLPTGDGGDHFSPIPVWQQPRAIARL